jgi:putative oxidoreductase
MKPRNFAPFTEDDMEHSKVFAIASWAMRGAAAAILLQTLFFKFTGARESVYIFTTLGMEPWGRIGSGVAELIASILLLIPGTVVWGAAISIAVIAGAIVSHLTVLGVKLPAVGDNGELFSLALVVLVCSIGAMVLHRHEIPFLASTHALSRES